MFSRGLRLGLAAGLVWLLGGAPCVNALEPGAPVYKVGDRVLCRDGGVYVPGTVTQVELGPDGLPQAYKIRFDSTGREWNIYNRASNFKVGESPAQAPAAGQPGGTTTDPGNAAGSNKHEAADGTVLADRPILDCGALSQPPARNGDSPPVELLKKLMRCALGERPADPGSDGAVTVDIEQASVQGNRPWQRTDHAQAGPGTLVWPIEVTYTVKTFYRTRTRIVKHRAVMSALVNSQNKWVTQLSGGPSYDYPEQSIPVR